MKSTIRFGMFETNSSSMHSLILASKAEYDQFINGELYFNVTHDWNDHDLHCKKVFIDKQEYDELFKRAQDLEKLRLLKMGFKPDEIEDEVNNSSFFAEEFISYDKCFDVQVMQESENSVQIDLEYFFG